jgi:hypothetical protein
MESTDTSRGGVRDSHHTRNSRSCLPSPKNELELKFRHDVEKFINGYSIVVPCENEDYDIGGYECNNPEYSEGKRGLKRYSQDEF